MIVLAIGDICGPIGQTMFERHAAKLKRAHGVDLCIANGENADLVGIKPRQAHRLYDAGADFITLGNHSWNRRQIAEEMEQSLCLIRPLNYSGQMPGVGYQLTEIGGVTVCVVNLLGRLLLDWNVDSPFYALEALLEQKQADITLVDFHAEATSEKAAMAYHFDGRVSALFGTHTHVQTADERILPGGTGFITDLGMTGAYHSIIGIGVEQSVNQFLGHFPQYHESPASGPALLSGALFDLEEGTGRCRSVERVRLLDEI